ncbi:MAG: D-glycero-beta-D-manno-heptose-7-phosphate kinase [Chlamydiales bacterium]|nr:D-glycero-beta-D-manno-heptose-7-phosphate kinase [Chlamydiales bacterium]
MSHLANAFQFFRPFTALVIGDFFFDMYITGRVKRISPEAPVPVLEVIKQASQPGGAGNVVVNLAALNAHVLAVGRIGDDEEGQMLKNCLEASGVDTSAFVIEPSYKTPVKHRFIADSQQLLRVDFETIQPLAHETEEYIMAQLPRLMQQAQIVALSDYAKGFLSRRLIEAVIQMARLVDLPVIVDPKGADFTKYRSATVLKPNLSEAYIAAGMPSSATLDAVAERLLELSQVDMLLITRSEAGMSLFEKNKPRIDFPVLAKEVKDVTGAGDTVLSVICLALASGLSMQDAAPLANIAACISIERLGCVQVTLPELAYRLLQTDRNRKIFDRSHSYALRYVLKDRPYSLLILQSGDVEVGLVLRAIKKLSIRENYRLVVYINDPQPTDEIIHLLSSLPEVDTIVLQDGHLQDLRASVDPAEIYYLNEGVDLLSTLRSERVLG